MKFFRLLLIAIIGLFAMSMRSDSSDLLSFFGVVTDEYTNAPLVGAKVSYVAENGESLTMKVSKKGKYDFLLPFDHIYRITYFAPGYVSKSMEVDARNIPKKYQAGGFGFDIDIILFKPKEGINYELYEKEPVGKAVYNPTKQSLEFDASYTSEFKARWQNMQK